MDGPYRHTVFPHPLAGCAAFLAWMAAFGAEPGRIALAVTGAYSQPLAESLTDQGFRVGAVNPAKIKVFARSELRRTQTDPGRCQAHRPLGP